MLVPAFKFQLQDTILPNLVSIGKYDGETPCLSCATNAGRVFIHNPHESGNDESVKYLNINRDITTLSSGNLFPNYEKDSLLIGTETNLLAYDVNNNQDLFYKDVPDGVSALTVGRISSKTENLAIVGGNCSLQGFDYEGTEQYWNVTGDNVTSLALMDVDQDGANELLVGSEDYAIRIFQENEVISEITESHAVTGLTNIEKTKYGYSLDNGTIGVYDKEKRVWRVKSKNKCNCIQGYDLDGDGVPEFISGWSNGKLEVRNESNGESIYKDHFGSAISGIVKGDYRKDGQEEIICCSKNGEVRGYLPFEKESREQLLQTKMEQERIRELNQKKQELTYELKSHEENLRKIKNGEIGSQNIDMSTRINCHLDPDPKEKCVKLCITASNNSIIKGVLVSAEHLFQGETKFFFQDNPESRAHVPLAPEKNIEIQIDVQVLCGNPVSEIFHVFEIDYRLPRFSMFVPVKNDSTNKPESFVKFSCRETPKKIASWINNSFNVKFDVANEEVIELKFQNIRNETVLFLCAEKKEQLIEFYSNDIELCSDLIQDFAKFMRIEELESNAYFPHEMEEFKELLENVQQYNQTRLNQTADMADNSQYVKALVIKAEDARIQRDVEHMKKVYDNLMQVNRDLMGEYVKKANNHSELLTKLKQVNQTIQQAARLRVGEAKSRVINLSRQAIKENNVMDLLKIIQNGST